MCVPHEFPATGRQRELQPHVQEVHRIPHEFPATGHQPELQPHVPEVHRIQHDSE
ncbi:hypothetical protein glysoja_032709 [Glycine soja]|uniref:Uncharacterized protein n=1 Tax=Glycine soja TaxID=3848 RepID=A0A0B2P968_GLYSO|nr:hypothetical protein glysoja_032709 [Glycine soja]